MDIFLIFILLIAISAIIAVPLVFLLELIGWTWTGVPYVPVPKNGLKKLADALSLTDDATVYDLGSGDGRVLYELAKNSPARFIGVEKAPFPFLASKIRTIFDSKKNVRIMYGDIYAVPITDATHVYTYLLSDVMDKLLPKFEQELKKGTRLVSCDFQFKTRQPSRTIRVDEGSRPHVLYVYDF